jgi:hypothetical protein
VRVEKSNICFKTLIIILKLKIIVSLVRYVSSVKLFQTNVPTEIYCNTFCCFVVGKSVSLVLTFNLFCL